MMIPVNLPAEIHFGRGIRSRLVKALPPGPVLFIAGKHSRSRIETEVIPLLERREFRLFCGVSPEPPLEEVEQARELGREIGAVSVVGWGGGSAIDVAKSVAVLLPCPGTVADYFYGRRTIPGKGAFFAALPTTAGTGAELTANAVLRDPATDVKQSLRGGDMLADIALIDPDLVRDCPPSVTAASGFDALTQAVESFLSRKATPVSRLLAGQAAEKLFLHLPRAFEGVPAEFDPVTEGSMLGAAAFGQSGLGAVHGLAHPIGSILHVPHGVCCAILLPEVLRWNLEAARDSFTELAGQLGCVSPEELIDRIETLRKTLHLPENFREYGLAPQHYPFILANCRSGSMKCNPRALSDAEISKLLERVS